MKTYNYFSFSLLIAALVVLPNCDMFKKGSKDESVTVQGLMTDPKEALVTIDKQTKVTAADFANYLEEFLEAQPQYRQFFEMMPDAEENIFDSLANETVIAEWVSRSGTDKKAEYQQDLAKILKYAQRNLAVKYFQDAFPVTVTEADLKKYYDENKDTIPELIATKGGVKAEGVEFETQAAAQAFLDKVKNPSKNFAQAAKEANKKVVNYGSVSTQSFEVDKSVRDKLLGLKNFVTRDVVKVNDKKWVVFNAMAKEETKYVPYDQVRAGLENFLKQQKGAENIMGEIEKLKAQYNVVVNKDFFARKKEQKQAATKAAHDQAMAEMQKAQEEKNPVVAQAEKSEVEATQAQPAVMGA